MRGSRVGCMEIPVFLTPPAPPPLFAGPLFHAHGRPQRQNTKNTIPQTGFLCFTFHHRGVGSSTLCFLFLLLGDFLVLLVRLVLFFPFLRALACDVMELTSCKLVCVEYRMILKVRSTQYFVFFSTLLYHTVRNTSYEIRNT